MSPEPQSNKIGKYAQSDDLPTMQSTEIESSRSECIELYVTPQEKALLMQAAANELLDVTSFVMRALVPVAQEIIEQTEHTILSEHDTQHMQQSTGDNEQNTGRDLIAFFRNSPLADVKLGLERDQATSRTITF